MLKLIITVIACAAVGVGLGQLKASMTFSPVEERFLGARATLAENRGEVSTEELLSRSSANAKLEIEGGSEFNFGTMKHGETMSHDFVFRNVGEDPLNLEMGGSTCKCTVGELDKSILNPGEETKVNLTWTALATSADFGQTATIFTSDPSQSEVKLKVFGRVARSFVVEPPSLSLGSFSVDEPIERKLHVFTYLENSQDLGEFVWSDEHTRHLVKFDVQKIEKDPNRFPNHQNAYQVHEVTLDIAPGLPLGGLSARIQFETDQGEKVGILEVPVNGKIVGDLTLFGGASFDSKRSVVDLGNVDSSEGATVTIWLAAQGEHRDEVRPEIQSMIPEDALEVTIEEPTLRGKRLVFPIRFNVPKGAAEAYYPGSSGSNFGKVIINTNLDVAKEVPVYVRLMVNK